MIEKPTLILDEKKCKKNISDMFLKARAHALQFRPHFKTHQSLEIGSWFKDIGVNQITVSSVTMAEYFSSSWNDITIAFPCNLREIDAINDLAEKITLNLMVESVESIAFLAKGLRAKVGIFLKIDVGYHRTGIDPANVILIDKILNVVDTNSLLIFKGFLGHAGHTYACRTAKAIRQVHNDSLDVMSKLKASYIENYLNLIVSLGDTPGCSVANDFSGVDEIRPGNFVFYDLTQSVIGSCSTAQISVALACPIVAIHKDRSEIVIYGGGVHLSKERLYDEEGAVFGRVVKEEKDGWGEVIPDMYVKSLSQEHGIIAVPRKYINNYNIGDTIMILPVHSCMTANLMKSYRTFDGRVVSGLS